MYKLIIRPILFCFDPEEVHYFTFSFVKFISKIPGVSSIIKSIYEVKDTRLEREVFGIKFKNPVGLAAGFDKDAKLYKEFSDFGFGFIEIGTVTPVGQEGNPKKRLFRLKADQAKEALVRGYFKEFSDKFLAQYDERLPPTFRSAQVRQRPHSARCRR